MTPRSATSCCQPFSRGAQEPSRSRMVGRFTLIEIIVVVLIVVLALAVVPPSLRTPRRFVITEACSTLRRACQDAGMRARGTGRTVRLIFEDEGKRLRIADGGGGVPSLPMPPAEPNRENGDNERTGAVLFADAMTYELSEELEWRLDASVTDAEGIVGFTFFASGAAVGPRLEFVLRGLRFHFEVDELTGRPIVTQLDD